MKTPRSLVASFALLLAGLLSACAPGQGLLPFEICDDGIDNNGDGAIDCFDEECLGERVCLPEVERFCSDGSDNDGDGAVDCNDNDCIFSDACICTSLGTLAVFPSQFPIIFEGEITEDDEDIFNGNCQEEGTGDNVIPISFAIDTLFRINVRIESPDADMVVQVRQICSDDNNSSLSCIPEGNTGNFEIFNNDTILFYVGPKEAGQTGTYRLIIDGERVGG